MAKMVNRLAGKNVSNDKVATEDKERRNLRDNALKIVMTSEARERLGNIKMVKPEVAQFLENNIIQQASSGRLTKPITDEELKKMLASMQQPKREFKFKRI